MKWLENNPVGLGLAVACGLLVLTSLVLGWAWSLPPSSGATPDAAGTQTAPDMVGVNTDLGPIADYQVVNERPVFNSSRRPVEPTDDGTEGLAIEDSEVADAPEVRLTGVVITPEQRLVTLTPATEGETLIAAEGMALEGEYAGWTVSKIDARQVTLESRNGDALDLELVVHDRMIEAPPEPEPPPEPEAEDAESGEDGEPMSRAEEIRQRIQERREQLRRQAEEAESEEEAERAEQKTTYQEAIRAMMNRNRNNDNESKDEDDEG